MTTTPLEMTEAPAGCEVVEFGRNAYVCDPGQTLVANARVAVWGDVGARRIAVVGIYKPTPGDPPGRVRLANWCGPRKGWEYNVYPCPPNLAAKVIGELVRPGRARRRNADLQRFLARRLRAPG